MARQVAWLLQQKRKQEAPAVEKSETSNVSVEVRFIENTEVETIKYACEVCEYTSQMEHGLNLPACRRSSLTGAVLVLWTQYRGKNQGENFVTNVVYYFVLIHT